MCPVEVFCDDESLGKIGPGPGTIQLDPPLDSGSVAWRSDETGKGVVLTPYVTSHFTLLSTGDRMEFQIDVPFKSRLFRNRSTKVRHALRVTRVE